jgi:hypothetical protein
MQTDWTARRASRLVDKQDEGWAERESPQRLAADAAARAWRAIMRFSFVGTT